MNAQQAILKIKEIFGDYPMEAPKDAPVQPKEQVAKMESIEYTLEDGSKIMCTKLEVGGMVTLADGTIPAMGEYKLADGTSIQIDEAGSILEIASPAEDAAPEEAPAEDMAKEKIAELQAEFQAKIDILQLEKDVLNDKLKSLTEKTSQGFAHVLEAIQDLSKMPTADPISAPQSFKFEKTSDIKYERLTKYRNAILNNKN